MIYDASLWLLLGCLYLAVGSFLNVVIHRLPLMILQPQAKVNLCLPASFCPSCRVPLRYRDNIPLQKTLTRINLSNQEITGVFPQISAVQLRYFSANRWQNRWTAHYALPQAIEVTVTTASWGPVTRIFMLTAEQP